MKLALMLAVSVLVMAEMAAQTSANVIQAQIVSTQVKGKAWLVKDGTKAPLAENDRLPQGATVAVGELSSVVLAFSSGTTVAIRNGSELVIEQFLQDPFLATSWLADQTEEPSISKLKLRFVRGEMVVNVKKLRFDQGSEMSIETPAGAAGVRSATIFRVKLMPMDAATAEFRVDVATGELSFSPVKGPQARFRPGELYAVTIPWTQ